MSENSGEEREPRTATLTEDKRDWIILKWRPSNKENRRPQARCKQESRGSLDSDETFFTGEGHSYSSRGASQAYIKDNNIINDAMESFIVWTSQARTKWAGQYL